MPNLHMMEPLKGAPASWYISSLIVRVINDSVQPRELSLWPATLVILCQRITEGWDQTSRAVGERASQHQRVAL